MHKQNPGCLVHFISEKLFRRERRNRSAPCGSLLPKGSHAQNKKRTLTSSNEGTATIQVNVMSGHQFLHPILPCEFLDSPEFESSRATIDEKFKVRITVLYCFISK